MNNDDLQALMEIAVRISQGVIESLRHVPKPIRQVAAREALRYYRMCEDERRSIEFGIAHGLEMAQQRKSA